MHNRLIILLLVLGFSVNVQGQILRDYMNDAQQTVDKVTRKKGGGLSNDDIISGLREALNVGSKNTTSKVSATDGFYGDPNIKIFMPRDAMKVEKTLREIGMGDQVDKAILSMNRGAEDACTSALPIFIDAIKSMTIDDGMSILKGKNDAATQYLKSKTMAKLTAAFRPIVEESLDKVEATKYWTDIITAYNNLPTTFNKINPDLPAYVTENALKGVFFYVAQEEAKIRANPAARVNDILKKVFGSLNQ